jgi:hypothetical protein
MRAAIVSLITAAGLAASAQAQDATTPPSAPPAATPPAATPPAAAPAATPPATADGTTAPGGGPAISTQAPAGSTQSAPQPDASSNPTLPTTGDGAAVINLLQNICVKAVKSGDLDSAAKAAGMKKDRRSGTWTMGLGTDRNYSISVQPQGSNKNVCQAELRYAVGQEKPIVNALNVWAFLHQPEMPLQRNDFVLGPDGVKRITLSWEYYTDKESTGLVLVQQKKADGTSLNARFDTATLLYSERKF